MSQVGLTLPRNRPNRELSFLVITYTKRSDGRKTSLDTSLEHHWIRHWNITGYVTGTSLDTSLEHHWIRHWNITGYVTGTREHLEEPHLWIAGGCLRTHQVTRCNTRIVFKGTGRLL